MKLANFYVVVTILLISIFFAPSGRCTDFRFGVGPSIHGRDIGHGMKGGYNLFSEMGVLTEYGHFLGGRIGYNSLFRESGGPFYMGEVGFSAVLNASPQKKNPYAVIGLGYAITRKGSDNGVYISAGLGWKNSISEFRQVFVQASAMIGFNSSKDSFGNDPGYLYIPITIGFNFYSP